MARSNQARNGYSVKVLVPTLAPSTCLCLRPSPGYLPQDLYKLDSSYGNESELRNLLHALKERNVKPVLDVVVNHRCGSGQDEEGRWTRYPGLRPEWNEDAVTSDTGGKVGHGTCTFGQLSWCLGAMHEKRALQLLLCSELSSEL